MAFSLNADFQDTFRNAIFGPLMSAQMPGTAVGPAQAPQVGGPGVPSFGFPGNVAFGADGLPAGIANNVEHPSNTFVTQTYYARANKDGAELKFVEGQFMFVHRDVSPLRIDREVYNLHTIYNLPYLNAILAEAWIKFTNAANSGDPEATRLRQLLSEYSEQEIMASERARRDYYATSVEQNLARQRLPNQADIPPFPQPQKIHILPQAYPPATPTGKTGTSADLETLAEFGRKNIYRYVIAPIYIMDQWNFGGKSQTYCCGTNVPQESSTRLPATQRVRLFSAWPLVTAPSQWL
jgi:hypothetical protein